MPRKALEMEEMEAEVPEQSQTFTVTVPCGGFTSLGLKMDTTSYTPMIKEIKDGAVQKFNGLSPQKSIDRCDVLISLDETTGTDAILQKMKETPPENVKLTIQRPRKMEISMVKTGSLGVVLNYNDISIGGVIKEIKAAGLIAEWNEAHPKQLVKAGDRIIGCNGKESLGDELYEEILKLKPDQEVCFMVLIYWCFSDFHTLNTNGFQHRPPQMWGVGVFCGEATQQPNFVKKVPFWLVG